MLLVSFMGIKGLGYRDKGFMGVVVWGVRFRVATSWVSAKDICKCWICKVL